MTLLVWVLISLAFTFGFVMGHKLSDASHCLGRMREAFHRDLDVLDEAEMSETSNA